MIDFNSINLKSGLERCKIHEIAIHLHAMYIYMFKLYNDVAHLQVSSTSICLTFIMHTLHDFDDFPVLINDPYSIFVCFCFGSGCKRKLARRLVRHENDDVITKQIMKFGNCLTAWRLGSSITDFFAVTD